MSTYEKFAGVYDELMDNIPYDMWCDYIVSLLHSCGINDGLVCELGCGTGEVTRRLADAGYDMIGIDNSCEMLEIAEDKKITDNRSDILYLMQDMREFELYGTVDAIVCVCDSINYLTDTNDITRVFRLANNYLEAGGIFICDFNTRHYYRDVVGDATIAEDREDVSFIWENYYDEETDINELTLSLFLPEDNNRLQPAGCSDSDNDKVLQTDAPLYRKYQEFHYQRGLTCKDMAARIRESGMEPVAMYNAFTKEPATDDSERVYVIAKETRQAGKHYE